MFVCLLRQIEVEVANGVDDPWLIVFGLLRTASFGQ